MQRLLAVPGSALNHVPREVLEWENEDARVCCGALQCLGLCYECDVLGTVGTMHVFEENLNRRSLPLFAVPCWPCVWLSYCCFGARRDSVRHTLRRVPLVETYSFDRENSMLSGSRQGKGA
jgi:hypothetical protein